MTMLDTSAVFDLLAGLPAAVDAYRDLERRKDRILIPTIVLYEARLVLTMRGAHRKLAKAERVLARMPRAPLDDASATRAADLGAHLSSRGVGIGPIDTLVAGTALAHGEPLLCSDPDFDRVPGLTVLRYR